MTRNKNKGKASILQNKTPVKNRVPQPRVLRRKNCACKYHCKLSKGQSSKNTFTLSVTIGGKKAIVLVDTRSNHTFLDLKFSTKINCNTVHNELERVTVAGGGELQTGAHILDMQYSVQGHTFNNSFKILPLQGYDIVLGGD